MRKQSPVPWYLYGGGILIVAMLAVGPVFLGGNPTAQVFFNIVVAVLTTLVSVQATRYYAANALQDNLTRYGLQAWRTLNALQVKVRQHVGTDGVPDTTLEAWIMDVDGAKWAWRDLLRDLFELQDRLQAETEEVAQRYSQAIAASSDPTERLKLEQKRATELAELQSQAPLPFKQAESVECPKCKTPLTARVGSSAGDSDWPVCHQCGAHFPVFRKADGTVEVSDRAPLATITQPCPHCQTTLSVPIYEDRELSFLIVCRECKAHLQFRGGPASHTFEDLGVSNAEFPCPHCGVAQSAWIAPGRRVSFRTRCKTCSKYVHIQGVVGDFDVSTS